MLNKQIGKQNRSIEPHLENNQWDKLKYRICYIDNYKSNLNIAMQKCRYSMEVSIPNKYYYNYSIESDKLLGIPYYSKLEKNCKMYKLLQNLYTSSSWSCR